MAYSYSIQTKAELRNVPLDGEKNLTAHS